MLDRREFSTTLALAVASGVIAPPFARAARRQSATLFDWQPINEQMRAAFGAGGNVLAVAGGGRTLLVDTKNAGYGGVLRAEAEAIGGPIERVVNTHHHGDHTGGNPFFTGDVPVVSQARGVARAAQGGAGTLQRIASDPAGQLERLSQQVGNMDVGAGAKQAGTASMERFVEMAGSIEADAFSATETFDDELEVRIGGVAVELRHISRGHTDNDLFVYVPQANLIHGGDLFFNGIHPFIDVGAGATTAGWQGCLAAMIETCDADTVVIPGHGPLSDVDGLRAFSGYFDELRRVVREAIDAGRTRDEITALRPAAFGGMPERRLDQNLGVVYDEITG